jgi:hypothetical protein
MIFHISIILLLYKHRSEQLIYTPYSYECFIVRCKKILTSFDDEFKRKLCYVI